MKRILTRSAVVCLVGPGLMAAAEPQPLWTDLSFAEALKHSQEEDRILVVYATASWCGPCRMMNQSTWQSEAVHEWFTDHGLALKVDVDDQPDLAQQLRVRAMPTLIAFREGERFDQSVGYHSAAELVSWLSDVRKGISRADRLLADAGDRVGPDGIVDVHARMRIARQLADGDAIKEATEEYLWLWDNMLLHNPAAYGVRLSFLIEDMRRLASDYDEAREAFSKRRAEYTRYIEEGTASRDDVVDWIRLAAVAGEEDSLLEWFDANRSNPRRLAMLRLGEREIADMLVEADRWADIAVLYDDPVEEVRRRIESDRRMMEEEAEFAGDDDDEAWREDMIRMSLRYNRERFAQMYAVLLAAGREDEAKQIAELLLESDDSTAARGALVTTALEAGQVRPAHLKWIEEAEEMGARVPRAKRQVTAALGLE